MGTKTVRVNTPSHGFGSGIKTVTVMGDSAPDPRVRQSDKYQHGGIKAGMGDCTFKVQRPVKHKRKNIKDKAQAIAAEADSYREGFTVEGDEPSQDFNGLSGMEAHLDNMLQEAYENDLRENGLL